MCNQKIRNLMVLSCMGTSNEETSGVRTYIPAEENVTLVDHNLSGNTAVENQDLLFDNIQSGDTGSLLPFFNEDVFRIYQSLCSVESLSQPEMITFSPDPEEINEETDDFLSEGSSTSTDTSITVLESYNGSTFSGLLEIAEPPGPSAESQGRSLSAISWPLGDIGNASPDPSLGENVYPKAERQRRKGSRGPLPMMANKPRHSMTPEEIQQEKRRAGNRQAQTKQRLKKKEELNEVKNKIRQLEAVNKELQMKNRELKLENGKLKSENIHLRVYVSRGEFRAD